MRLPDLAGVGISDAPRVGQKAAALGMLRGAGFPVPPGVCVPVQSFHHAMAPYRGAISAILTARDLQDAAVAIQALVTDLAIPRSLRTALHNTLTTLIPTNAPMVVRSSATLEDLARTSFAGHYTSQINVRGMDGVERAILDCWRSFFSRPALMARVAHGFEEDQGGMGVLIQPLVAAECSGVCFTVDPVLDDPDLILIEGAWGLGVGIVDGSVAVDRWRLDRYGFQVVERHVAQQREQILPDRDGGLRRELVPSASRGVACLPDAWAQRVAQYAVLAESLFGRRQDMEWAIAADQVWILQSRPITALPRALRQVTPFPVTWESRADSQRLWVLEQPASRGRAPLLPIEQDYVRVVEGMREETCKFLGADRNRDLKLANGRSYFADKPVSLSAGDMRVRRTTMQDLRARLQDQERTSWDYWGPEIVRATRRLDAFDAQAADGAELAAHLEDALAVRRRHYMLHPLQWFEPSPAYYAGYARLSGLSGDEGRRAADRLLGGADTLLTDLTQHLFELARLARDSTALRAFVTDPPANLNARLRELPEAEAFRAALTELLEIYGNRNGDGYGSEATICTPTWREQPAQVLRLAAVYLDPDVPSPEEARAQAQAARTAQVEVLCQDGGETADVFRQQMAYAQRCLTVLEMHNHYVDQLAIGQLRQAVLYAADWLVERGVLAMRDDVFWLHFDEVGRALTADLEVARGDVSARLGDRIAERRALHNRWVPLQAPPILGFPDLNLPPRPTRKPAVGETRPEGGPGRVRGLGASPGRASGRARVVTNPALLPDLAPGDVLVAPNAGPLWTPFFAILSGLVLDGGGVTQHAAVTAREYGVPAVIGTRNGTRRIPDGVWVAVDGTAGTVLWEPPG
jgi:phosphohistidine swiveling domain-containing protein